MTSQDKFAIINCPKCESEIAVDDRDRYDIDCDCGAVIQKGLKHDESNCHEVGCEQCPQGCVCGDCAGCEA